MNHRDGCSHSFALQFSSISRFFISILREKNIYLWLENENCTFHSSGSVCSEGGVDASCCSKSLAHWVAPFITSICIHEANLYVRI